MDYNKKKLLNKFIDSWVSLLHYTRKKYTTSISPLSVNIFLQIYKFDAIIRRYINVVFCYIKDWTLLLKTSFNISDKIYKQRGENKMFIFY